MSYKRAQEDEYQLQYYGITTGLIVKTVYEGALDIIKKTLDDIEPGWLENNPHIDAMECRSNFNRLYREYAAHTLVILERLEGKLRDIYNVPANVLLPSDKYQETQVSDKELDDMEEELLELEKEYINKRMFMFLCQKELEILEGLQPVRERVEDMLSKLDALKTSNNASKEENLRHLIEKHNKKTNMIMEKLFSSADEPWVYNG